MEAVVSAVLLLAGFGLGFCAAMMFKAWRDGLRSPTLPPATIRQLARATRANRADLRKVRVERGTDRLSVPAPLDSFDEGKTHP